MSHMTLPSCLSADNTINTLQQKLQGSQYTVGRFSACGYLSSHSKKPQINRISLQTGEESDAVPVAPPRGHCLPWRHRRDVIAKRLEIG
ncbi:hypothetical protein LSAT2_012023 [Lamellibrachia satsuma]|nr:hypothetical protein LSAT2_012023 [Lamellibrachia satsuma]